MRIANLPPVALNNKQSAAEKTRAFLEERILAEGFHNDRSPLATLVFLSWEREDAADAASC
jgi:hypothetical protein